MLLHDLPNFRQAAAVVPPPPNGSRTKSPGSVCGSKKCVMSCSGFGVGCLSIRSPSFPVFESFKDLRLLKTTIHQ